MATSQRQRPTFKRWLIVKQEKGESYRFPANGARNDAEESAVECLRLREMSYRSFRGSKFACLLIWF